MIEFIRSHGFYARTIGKFGYPREGEVNLKREAVRANLGKWGKNSLLLHPIYGTRLRFAAISTNAPLVLGTSSVVVGEEDNPLCKDCNLCIESCPVNVLEPYRMVDSLGCLSNSNNMVKERDRLIPCDDCLCVCPVGRC